jgi:hypothetical protein
MPKWTSKRSYGGYAAGFRSGLEEVIAEQLRDAGVEYRYEEVKLKYVKPASNHTYTPDFILPNGIIVETKGRFTTGDRTKHLLVKKNNPDADIRFVFTRSKSPLYKGAKTTYADWCQKYGFAYADKLIPIEWLKEPKK